ncbi:Tyrosine-protein kinase Fer, partial [Frankliniella fusca]
MRNTLWSGGHELMHLPSFHLSYAPKIQLVFLVLTLKPECMTAHQHLDHNFLAVNFSCSSISFDKAISTGVYFTLKILCFPPYTVGKAKTSMSSSKVRDKGMLPSPGAILTPESATKPLLPVEYDMKSLHFLVPYYDNLYQFDSLTSTLVLYLLDICRTFFTFISSVLSYFGSDDCILRSYILLTRSVVEAAFLANSSWETLLVLSFLLGQQSICAFVLTFVTLPTNIGII